MINWPTKKKPNAKPLSHKNQKNKRAERESLIPVILNTPNFTYTFPIINTDDF